MTNDHRRNARIRVINESTILTRLDQTGKTLQDKLSVIVQIRDVQPHQRGSPIQSFGDTGRFAHRRAAKFLHNPDELVV